MNKNLYFYTARLKGGGTTWALLPLTDDTSIIDATYLPEEGGLLIMLNSKKETFIERPATNDRGEVRRRGNGEIVTREARFETYYEHFMSDKDDIKDFVSNFSINYKGQPLFEEVKKSETVKEEAKTA